MRVILKADVAGLGKRGDVVEVSEGYARNYLVPRRLAQEASPGALRAVQHLAQEKQKKSDREQEQARHRADRLEGRLVTIRARAGEGGKLFGSVTGRDVAEAIAAQFGFDVDRRRVLLDEPIKAVGTFPVRVHLHPGIDATVQVRVIPE
ncbi:MAG: 50S ribosomal protein L9 [Bacillota bacterium]|jgi:large subunit ribosomal protein L9